MSPNEKSPSPVCERIAARLEQKTLEEIDAFAKTAIHLPCTKVTRSMAMRALIHRGLCELNKVGLDGFLADLDVTIPRGRGRFAALFGEKKEERRNPQNEEERD